MEVTRFPCWGKVSWELRVIARHWPQWQWCNPTETGNAEQWEWPESAINPDPIGSPYPVARLKVKLGSQSRGSQSAMCISRHRYGCAIAQAMACIQKQLLSEGRETLSQVDSSLDSLENGQPNPFWGRAWKRFCSGTRHPPTQNSYCECIFLWGKQERIKQKCLILENLLMSRNEL